MITLKPRFQTSYRAKLQVAFLGLAFSAVLLTGWQVTAGATSAMRDATFDRLTAIRETRRREIERYFQDFANHVLALASDESTLRAVEEFQAGIASFPAPTADDEALLQDFYRKNAIPELLRPQDARSRTLQYQYLVANPHPIGAKDRLLIGPEGQYGAAHRRYHPTLHRYQQAFGFYDILLAGAKDARVLYTVRKEVDLGLDLRNPAFRGLGLAEAYEEAMKLDEPERFVIRDYTQYAPSHGAPAAFVAAPVWRSGEKIGVLAIQTSIEEIDRVMSGEQQGLGETGQTYLVGSDGLLRSGLRFGSKPSVLSVAAGPEITALVHARAGTEEAGRGIGSASPAVLRSHTGLRIPGLDWALIAEIDQQEAFAPVTALRRRIVFTGALLALGFLLAATILARSVTVPVLVLLENVRKLAKRDFAVRIEPGGSDELGLLAESFRDMARDLDRTTVSKEELEKLAGKLINAQEDERRRIARELHDDLTQRMAGVAIEAGSLAKSNDPAALRAGVQTIREKVAQLADDIHGLSRSLHPAMLDDLGLAATVTAEARASFERGGPPVDCVVTGDFETLSRDLRLTLLRIVQEGLRNVYRHAAADQVTLRLERMEQEVQLTIADDGRGFDRSDPEWHSGLGLASMEERARLFRGQFAAESAPGKGVRLTVRIPVA